MTDLKKERRSVPPPPAWFVMWLILLDAVFYLFGVADFQTTVVTMLTLLAALVSVVAYERKKP